MNTRCCFFSSIFFLISVFSMQGQESFLDSKASLRSHVFEKDTLYVMKETGSPLQNIVLQYDSKVLIKKFDEEGREISRKVYEQDDTKDTLVESHVFYYKEGESVFYKKEHIQYIDSIRTFFFYDEKGRVLSSEKRVFDAKNKTDEEKLILKENYLWDEKGRLIQKDEFFDKSHIVYENSYEKSFANEFIYDQKKFLNDVLTEETTYENENEYSIIHYFSNAQRIVSFYKGGLKKEDFFYQGDLMIRRLKYE